MCHLPREMTIKHCTKYQFSPIGHRGNEHKLFYTPQPPLQPRIVTKCAPGKAAIEAHFVAMQLSTKRTKHHSTLCCKFTKIATKCAFAKKCAVKTRNPVVWEDPLHSRSIPWEKLLWGWKLLLWGTIQHRYAASV
jgi:hypothetical protein